jgi:predicted transcriptional regulator
MQDALNIRIDSDLKARLQARAEFEDRTLTQIVVKALTIQTNRWNQPTGKKASK